MMDIAPALIKSRSAGLEYLFGRRQLLFKGVAQVFQAAITDRTYHVIRGAVNWTNWDFNAHPFAVSILSRQNSFLKQDRSDFNTMTLVIEVMTGNPFPPDENGLIDERLLDGVLDDIYQDTVLVIKLLPCIADELNNPVVIRYHSDEVATEVHDAAATLQGIVFEITLDY